MKFNAAHVSISVSVFLVHVPSSVIEFISIRGMEGQLSVFSEKYSKSMVGLVTTGNSVTLKNFGHFEKINIYR